jgi:hypothetical protein
VRWIRSSWRTGSIESGRGCGRSPRDTLFAILAFTVVGDRAVTIDIFNDRELVPRLVKAGSGHTTM